MFRIAHVSDLHVLSPAGTEWRRLVFNKRITGHANLLWQRGRVYRRGHLVAVLEEVAVGADHVVVTGDITNLSLESEYEAARELLDDLARRIEVTVVPGPPAHQRQQSRFRDPWRSSSRRRHDTPLLDWKG